MPASEQVSRSSYQPKPPRLRAACNQCNTAKVKCSGERSGCGRCTSIHVECVYAESRVGKVQGVRTKRKKTQEDPPGPDDTTRSRSNSVQVQDEDAAEAHETITVSASDLPSPQPHVPGPRDQTLPGWTPDGWNWNEALLSLETPVGMFADVSDTLQSISRVTSGIGDTEPSSTTSISAGESNLPPLDLDRIGNVATAASPNTTLPTPLSQISAPLLPTSLLSAPAGTAPLPSVEPSLTELPRLKTNLDGKCVMALTNIIITMEQYLLSELKVLDLVINTVRSVTNEMRKVLQCQQESRCDRCILLFLTIMYQVITLLEAGANSIFEAEASDHEGSGGMSVDFTPKFGFGAFSINAEEQRSLKLHVIRKECQNAGEMLAQIVALAKLGPMGSPPATPEQVEERAKCFNVVQRRLKDLSDKACSIN